MRDFPCAHCKTPFPSRTARDDHEDRCSAESALPVATAANPAGVDVATGSGASAVRGSAAGAPIDPPCAYCARGDHHLCRPDVHACSCATAGHPDRNKNADPGLNPGPASDAGGLSPQERVSPMGAPAANTDVVTWNLEQAYDLVVGEAFVFSDDDPDLATALVATTVTAGPRTVRIGVRRPDGTTGEWGVPRGTLVYVADEKARVAS